MKRILYTLLALVAIASVLPGVANGASKYPVVVYTPEIKRAAQAGDLEAQYVIGHACVMHDCGAGLKSLNEGLNWLNKAMAKGSPLATAALAMYYSDNWETEGNMAKAKRLFTKAKPGLEKMAAEGCGHAYAMLARAYSRYGLVEENRDKAIELAQKGAELGDPQCYTILSWLMTTPQEQFNMAMRAAELGAPESICHVAFAYLTGNGVTKDNKKAIEWFRKGAEINLDYCLTNLGYIYWNSEIVERDLKKALYYFKRSAELGNEYSVDNVRRIEDEIKYGPADTGPAGGTIM